MNKRGANWLIRMRCSIFRWNISWFSTEILWPFTWFFCGNARGEKNKILIIVVQHAIFTDDAVKIMFKFFFLNHQKYQRFSLSSEIYPFFNDAQEHYFFHKFVLCNVIDAFSFLTIFVWYVLCIVCMNIRSEAIVYIIAQTFFSVFKKKSSNVFIYVAYTTITVIRYYLYILSGKRLNAVSSKEETNKAFFFVQIAICEWIELFVCVQRLVC